MRIVRLYVVIMMMIVVGCHTRHSLPPPPPTIPNWPTALSDFRFRWSAEPGIDLTSGPAVPVRAYLESHRVGDFTLDINAVYPGFRRAVPKQHGPSLSGVLPSTDSEHGFGRLGLVHGNEYFHILELTPMDTGYRAYVCDGLYKIFHQVEHTGEYVSVPSKGDPSPNIDASGVRLWGVEVTDRPVPHALATVTVPQRGPNPAPLGDVFGPWVITGVDPYGYVRAGHPDEAYKRRHRECADRMAADGAHRQAIYTDQRDTPPPADPAVPGWPGSHA